MKTHSKLFFAMLLVGLMTRLTASPHAQENVVFHGRPSIKISEGGLERVPIDLSRELADTAESIITQEDGKFYWAPRRHIEMGAVRNGPFVTYVALNRTGHVRLFDRNVEINALVTPAEEQFNYVEHILLGLRSVTYYGNSLK
jgi:hypothetical protein